jgi:hypothetical protein
MSEQAHNFSPAQRDSMASRTQVDASLLIPRGEAEYDEHGHLSPTGEQIERLYIDNVLEPQVPEFMDKTPEGQAISAHLKTIQRFDAVISSGLGNAVMHDTTEPLPEVQEFREWSEYNRLGIDFDELSEEAKKPQGDRPYYLEMRLRDLVTPMDKLTLGLIQFPQFRLGKEVTIERSERDGHPAYLESGWTVSEVMASGKLKVTRVTEKATLDKFVSIDRLWDWNRPAKPAET